MYVGSTSRKKWKDIEGMEDATIIPQDIRDAIGNQFGIGIITSYSRVRGCSASNFRIETKDCAYFLKLRDNNTPQKPEWIEILETHLAEHGVRTPAPLPTLNGNLSLNLTKEDSATLYPWVEGIVKHEKNFDEESLKQSAEILSKIHITPPPQELPRMQEITGFLSDEKATFFSKQFDELSENMETTKIEEEPKRKISELINIKKSFLCDTRNRTFLSKDVDVGHLVHGDFHNENLLFENSNVTAVLDLELAHIGQRMEDVATFIFLACCNSGFEQDNISLASSFLRHYHKCLPFSSQELEHGIAYKCFISASSLFLERRYIATKDPFFLILFDRDIKKFSFLQKHLSRFILSL